MSFLRNIKIGYLKIDVHARLPSIFSTSHKMPRLPWNLHVVTLDAALTMTFAKTRLLQSAVPATHNEDGQVQSAAPATKTKTHLLKTSQKYCTCQAKPVSTSYETRLNLTKCHSCHAKRSNATQETIGTAIRPSRERLRTVADGCERLRTVANGCGRKRNVQRTHSPPPDPQSETGTLATHSGKNVSVRL